MKTVSRMVLWFVAWVVAVALAVSPSVAVAAAASLDTSFGGDGRVTTDFGGAGNDRASDVALQPNGRIVAAGSSVITVENFVEIHDFAISRYFINGRLDDFFSGDGKVTTDFGGGTDDRANSLAVWLNGSFNGQVVAAGSTTPAPGEGVDDFAIARYNPNGTLDRSFGGDGKVITDFGGSDRAFGVTIQTDGKVVAAGDSSVAFGDPHFALARYNRNGTLDTSFGGDGKVTTNFAGGGVALAVEIQPDGKIVVVGYVGRNAGPDFALARYNRKGTLDTSFGRNGKVTTDFRGAGDFAEDLALQADGKIVAAGSTVATVDEVFHDFALARYNSNGTLDTSFSGDGKVITRFGGINGASGVGVQPDGKIVAAGGGLAAGSGAPDDDFAIARYNPNGTLDRSFGGDGKVTTDFGGHDAALGMTIQTNGRIVAAGFTSPDGSSQAHFALARYLG
jgi:uncharacterized delta-60 repeat protein